MLQWILLILILITQKNLFDKVLKEQKTFFLLGYFNLNSINYGNHNPTSEFLDPFAI